MLLHPSVEFKAVERDALGADRDLGEVRPDLGVEAVAVHAEVAGGVAEAQQARQYREGPRPIAPCRRPVTSVFSMLRRTHRRPAVGAVVATTSPWTN